MFRSIQSCEWALVPRHRITQKCVLIGVVKRVVRMSCIPGDRFTINLQKQIKIDIVCNRKLLLECI